MGAQQEASAFCIHVLPTGSVHGRATDLGTEACVGEGAPRILPLLLAQPQPPLAPVPPLRPSWDPETLTSSQERSVEATRDRPKDVFTASGGAERTDTQGHTQGHTLVWGDSPSWRLRRGRSGVGGLKALIPGASHSLFSKMGRHKPVAARAVVQTSCFVDCDHLQGGSHHESGGTTRTDRGWGTRRFG